MASSSSLLRNDCGVYRVQSPCAYGGSLFVRNTYWPLALKITIIIIFTRIKIFFFRYVDRLSKCNEFMIWISKYMETIGFSWLSYKLTNIRLNYNSLVVHALSHQLVVTLPRASAGEVFVCTRTRPRPEARLRSNALGKVCRSHVMITTDRIWRDVIKSFKKQISNCINFKFYIRVKFKQKNKSQIKLNMSMSWREGRMEKMKWFSIIELVSSLSFQLFYRH